MEKKKLVLDPILTPLAQIQSAKFFFKNVDLTVTRYHGQLSSCTISEKTNGPFLRKFTDRWMDGPADRLTVGHNDFIGCSQTNAEHPK